VRAAVILLTAFSGLLRAAPALAQDKQDKQTAKEAPVMPGKRCGDGKKLPAFEIDSAKRRVRLVHGGFAADLPKGWTATLERPELVVLSAPTAVAGVRPTFELFVSPVCAIYDQPFAARRVAGRGFAGLMSAQETATQIQNGRFSAGLGGPVGRSFILSDVTLRTKSGERTVSLYETHLGDAKSFGLHASAVCPVEKRKPGAEPAAYGACEETYFGMLKAAEY
jgi:hypothetical protein